MPNLKNFNDNQVKAVLHKEGACVVIAGAGSGKTRVLTHRIQNLIEQGVRPENILAMTFTKKASEEMKDRLASLIGMDAELVTLGTFHSIFFRLLKEEWATENNNLKNADIAPDWWSKKVMKEIISPPSKKFPYGLNMQIEPRAGLSFIGRQKNSLVHPDDTFEMSGGMEFMEDKLRKMYKEYEKRKKIDNKIDFDDMLILAYDKLKSSPSFLGRCRERFRYVLVDEYQDTNKAQDEILRLICGEHRNIFVVGDDKQSIYGFRSAIVDLIINFKQDWDATMIPLNINYRSTANIVEWANRLIKNNTNQVPIETIASKPQYKDPIIVTAFDEDEEAEIIADEIVTLMMDGYQPKDFSILYRTNAQSRALEEAMIKAKLPYVVLGSASFYDRKEIKDMLAYLRLAVDLRDDDSLARIINTPNRFLGKAYLDAINLYSNRYGISLHEALIKAPVSSEWRYQGAKPFYLLLQRINDAECTTAELLRMIRDETDYDNWLVKDDSGSDSEETENERLENINSLMSAAHKYPKVEDFLEYIDSVANKKNTNKGDDNKVKLMSIHRSKGLEFPVVFVAGVGHELLPHRNAVSDAHIEEERRLMYVAMTRAEKLLYISFCVNYQQKECGASIFIDELIKSNKKQAKENYVWL
ncbi:ATP-dependent helicase [Paenibacillus chitinolyticus]|uniref:ATP-dependent helicase n=1 Tax=Paenibacillus chitinolyticus TaxID=79263 RepID=UPI003D022933